MRLIHSSKFSHVSNDTLEEFESDLLSNKTEYKVAQINGLIFKIKLIIYRLFRKIGIELFLSTSTRFQNPLKDQKHLFVIMMGLESYKLRPFNILTKHGRSVYLFDAWPHDHEKIITFVNQYKINYLFVTASDAVYALKPKLKHTIIKWIPEGINPSEYKQDIKISDKTIDVLALGRKFDQYHLMIVDELNNKGYNYQFEIEKGTLIFPTRLEFIQGIADSKISICFPSSITHPERSGNIETMTIRYLQSMISKCLILGHAPKEMIDLFGYNPVIEIDYSNPVNQIETILENYNQYEELINRNYYEVINKHTWQCRWELIKSVYLANSKN